MTTCQGPCTTCVRSPTRYTRDGPTKSSRTGSGAATGKLNGPASQADTMTGLSQVISRWNSVVPSVMCSSHSMTSLRPPSPSVKDSSHGKSATWRRGPWPESAAGGAAAARPGACLRTCGPRPACSMGPIIERTLSHSGSTHAAGSRRENSTRPERTILAKKPSFDFRPVPIAALYAMVEVGMGVGAIEDAIGGVVDAQVQPCILAALAQTCAGTFDGIVGDFPVHEQAVRIHGHAGHAVIVVGPGNGSGRLVLGVLAHFEFVRPGRIGPIASGRGCLLDHRGQVALGGRLP